MREFVYGKDVVMSALKGDEYVPFACIEEVRLNMKSELLASAAPGSGAWEEFRPTGKNGWTASLAGVTVLKDDNDVMWFPLETLLAQVRQSGLDVRFDFTDKSGYGKYAVGHVYLPETEISSLVGNGEFSRYTIALQGSGPLDLEGVVVEPINETEVKRLFFIANDGQTTFQSNQLIARPVASILQVSREGDDKYNPITSGSPSDRQVLYNSGAGSITFAIACMPGEYISILYKES